MLFRSATFLECEHSLVSWGPWLMAPARAVELLGDYGSDTDFWVQLGCRLGYPDLFWDGDAERSFGGMWRRVLGR